jgi:hypothetical protein
VVIRVVSFAVKKVTTRRKKRCRWLHVKWFREKIPGEFV